MKKIDHLPRYAIIIIFFIVVVGYALFQSRFLILGPRVNITYPEDGAIVSSGLVVLEGTAKNVAWITLNGRQIFTNEEGHWSEKLLVSPGLSTATVEARDRFGRETVERVRILLN